MNLELVPHEPARIEAAQAAPSSPHLKLDARKRSLSSSANAALDPRQRRKVSRACDICKTKKAKCSGTVPCESCQRKGLECLYEARYSRGKPPTPPQSRYPPEHTRDDTRTLSPREREDRPTPRPLLPYSSSYLDRPQHHIATHQQHISAFTLPQREDSRTILNPSPPPNAKPREQEGPSRASPELDVAEQYSDSTSGLAFLQRAWRRLSNNQSSHAISGTLDSAMGEHQKLTSAGDKPFQDQGNIRLPPIDKVRELVKLYFDLCIATYRLLHRGTVESWVTTLVGNYERKVPLHQSLGRPQAAILLAALSMATFHQEKAKGASASAFSPINAEASLRQSDDLFCEAVRLTEAETGFPTLESAQARLIQVLYLLTSSRMNQAWYTFGEALQIISALGLHRRKDSKRCSTQHRRDYIEDQCRKRTFWVTYTLDKYMGVMFGRPRHFHDEDIDQDFPDAVNDEDMTSGGPVTESSEDCHIESLIFHARLAQIVGKISREVYSIKSIQDRERIAASHQLGQELRQWKAELPPILGAINPSSLIPSFRRQTTALNLAYSHAVMLAHRPFLLKNLSSRDELRDMAMQSITECIAAAQVVLQTVDRLAREGPVFHAFWWTHYVTFCALVVFYVWAIQHSQNSDLSSRLFDLAERCLTHLAQATATNSPSRRYSIILQELRAEAKRRTTRRENHLVPITTSAAVNVNQSTGMQSPSFRTTGLRWDPISESSPTETATPRTANFLDDWQTTDWLDLDSSAFGPFPGDDNSSAPLDHGDGALSQISDLSLMASRHWLQHTKV
ncbi:fungal-specific transcription factor domain-domain-containing protein [Clohesyomyces aquaticus]|uniref:Fungal-specific transcription factor domain-domain-containing protein n=1 Tax=Clohesyomyces aquaticus TaxID=1231657 RepID=A0A1Y1YZN4_9PLEO|nr:fungal-specific transcription factor domain-domain-containing protein [Clohesyomyces aquaticus]